MGESCCYGYYDVYDDQCWSCPYSISCAIESGVSDLDDIDEAGSELF